MKSFLTVWVFGLLAVGYGSNRFLRRGLQECQNSYTSYNGYTVTFIGPDGELDPNQESTSFIYQVTKDTTAEHDISNFFTSLEDCICERYDLNELEVVYNNCWKPQGSEFEFSKKSGCFLKFEGSLAEGCDDAQITVTFPGCVTFGDTVGVSIKASTDDSQGEICGPSCDICPETTPSPTTPAPTTPAPTTPAPTTPAPSTTPAPTGSPLAALRCTPTEDISFKNFFNLYYFSNGPGIARDVMRVRTNNLGGHCGFEATSDPNDGNPNCGTEFPKVIYIERAGSVILGVTGEFRDVDLEISVVGEYNPNLPEQNNRLLGEVTPNLQINIRPEEPVNVMIAVKDSATGESIQNTLEEFIFVLEVTTFDVDLGVRASGTGSNCLECPIFDTISDPTISRTNPQEGCARCSSSGSDCFGTRDVLSWDVSEFPDFRHFYPIQSDEDATALADHGGNKSAVCSDVREGESAAFYGTKAFSGSGTGGANNPRSPYFDTPGLSDEEKNYQKSVTVHTLFLDTDKATVTYENKPENSDSTESLTYFPRNIQFNVFLRMIECLP